MSQLPRDADADRQPGSDGHNGFPRSVTAKAEERDEYEEILSLMESRILSSLKPLIRDNVRKEVLLVLGEYELHARKKKRYCKKTDSSRMLQLKFTNKLSFPIYTMTKVEGEGSSALTIDLVNVLTGKNVTSGPESSMGVEIVVVKGDFKGDEDDNWTTKHFDDSIVTARKDKRPLLTGDVFLNLNKGTGVVGDLKITDNSSWVSSGRFRLAVRVADGYFDEMRVKEAITEAFVVRETRGKACQKSYPPKLGDEVWRLEKIAKDGKFHQRLRSKNINTVKDFLTLLHTDSQALKHILGMTANTWEFTVSHAKRCILSGQKYVYYRRDAQRMGVVFNIVRTVIGLVSDQQFTPIKDLPEVAEDSVQQLVKDAYQHWDEVVPYPDATVNFSNVPINSLSCGSMRLEIPQDSCSSHHQAEGSRFLQPCVSSPTLAKSLDDDNLQDIDEMGKGNNDFTLSFGDLWNDCNLDGTLSLGPESLADHVNTHNGMNFYLGVENLQEFSNIFGNNGDTQISEEGLQRSSFGATLQTELGPQAENVTAARSLFNTSMESVAANGKGRFTWMTLIAVMKFSKRILTWKETQMDEKISMKPLKAF